MLPALLAAFLLQADPRESNDFWTRGSLLGDPGGARKVLADYGITTTLEFTGELVSASSGGIHQDSGADLLLDWVVEADFQALLGWTGGSGKINPMWLAGDGVEGDVGDLTKVSNITGRGGVRVFEFWLQQAAFDGAVSIRAGILAADQEFAITAAGLLYSNSVFGGPVFLSANLRWPIYPVGAPGVRLRVDPAKGVYVQGAVYDGDPGSEDFNRSGLRVRWNSDEGVFSIVEGGWTWGDERPGTLKAGVFYHSADVLRFDTGRSASGLPGGYMLAEQKLCGGVDVFLRMGTAAKDRAFVSFGLDAGINVTGLLPGRPADILGLGLIYARISRDFADTQPNPGPWGYESVFEATYKVAITPAWSLQPDLQLVFHPGGSSATPRATVLALRIDVFF